MTPLHHSMKNGHVRIAEMLLSHDADINAKDKYRRTPLHIAVYNKKLEGVYFLLDKGSDPTIEDINGLTGLHIASEQGYTEILELYLRVCPQVNIK